MPKVEQQHHPADRPSIQHIFYGLLFYTGEFTVFLLMFVYLLLIFVFVFLFLIRFTVYSSVR